VKHVSHASLIISCGFIGADSFFVLLSKMF